MTTGKTSWDTSMIFRLIRPERAGLLALILLAASAVSFAQYPELSDARIDAIAQMLTEKPAGFGVPCTNRAAWEPIAPNFADSVKLAEGYIANPLPGWEDDAYLQFSIKGTRPFGEAMMHRHDGQLGPLVLAECGEWKGRFIPRIAEQLDAISSQRAWTLPAHDSKLENYNRTRYYVDLNAATLGRTVAEALYLLGDKLPPATRQRAMDALELHMFAPTRRSLSGVQQDSWLHVQTNWNSVCLNGVTGAALTVLPSRTDRALFAAAAEHYSAYYLESFRDSGYDDEGIGYWSYGFSNYEWLREQLWLSTGGKIDLFDNPKARKAALFGFQFAMLPGVYADFADARFMSVPDPSLLASIDRIFHLGVFKDDLAVIRKTDSGPLPVAVLANLPIHSERNDSDASAAELSGLRVWYGDAGILLARPATGGNLAITIKAGGNSAHSHNDIGSFSIGLGSTQPVGDPGGPYFYTADTFTSKRYESRLLNSFGHPVPSIDGHLQLDATKVKLPPVTTSFSPGEDAISMDITAAYDAPNLKKLTRTMHFARSGPGAIEVADSFEITSPSDIEESLPTHGTCRQIDSKTLQFDLQDAHLLVTIESPSGFTLTQEKVDEYGDAFTRVGVHLHLAHSGRIVMQFHEMPSK